MVPQQPQGGPRTPGHEACVVVGCPGLARVPAGSGPRDRGGWQSLLLKGAPRTGVRSLPQGWVFSSRVMAPSRVSVVTGFPVPPSLAVLSPVFPIALSHSPLLSSRGPGPRAHLSPNLPLEPTAGPKIRGL